MSFILTNCIAISIIFVLILFVSIVYNKRIVALVISFVTMLFGSFLLLYAFAKISGFDALDIQIKGLMIIGEGFILLVITSVFISVQETKRKRCKVKEKMAAKGGDEMAIGVALTVLVVGLMFASGLSRGKTAKRKYIVWGTTIILIIAPSFSWAVSILFAISQEEGFAGVALMMLLFPFFFLVGIVTLLIGVFKKESTNRSI
ncbi:hypothetical protein MUB15_12375 [Priestia sp. OVS21]|nr:hypothetical protein [Priestia sp. OVS21]